MKIFQSITALILLLLVGLTLPSSKSDALREPPSNSLIVRQAESSEPFETMMKVLTHKRCMNCHPAGDQPRQGEDSHLHLFDMERGTDNNGLLAVTCNTCHQSENNNYSGVPGAPHWSMAPRSMAWEGLTRAEIAQTILDRSKNGNRSLAEIEHHMTEDALVLWAFDPGVDGEGNPREAPPVSKEEFIDAVKQWVAAGAVIPSE